MAVNLLQISEAFSKHYFSNLRRSERAKDTLCDRLGHCSCYDQGTACCICLKVKPADSGTIDFDMDDGSFENRE